MCRSPKLSPTIQVLKMSSVISKISTVWFHCWRVWRNGLWLYRLVYCWSGLGPVARPSVCGNVASGSGQGVTLFYIAKQLLATQKRKSFWSVQAGDLRVMKLPIMQLFFFSFYCFFLLLSSENIPLSALLWKRLQHMFFTYKLPRKNRYHTETRRRVKYNSVYPCPLQACLIAYRNKKNYEQNGGKRCRNLIRSY
jgi:hypothetical protein